MKKLVTAFLTILLGAAIAVIWNGGSFRPSTRTHVMIPAPTSTTIAIGTSKEINCGGKSLGLPQYEQDTLPATESSWDCFSNAFGACKNAVFSFTVFATDTGNTYTFRTKGGNKKCVISLTKKIYVLPTRQDNETILTCASIDSMGIHKCVLDPQYATCDAIGQDGKPLCPREFDFKLIVMKN